MKINRLYDGSTTVARWSRGMIRASDARGPGFKSRASPILFSLLLIHISIECNSKFNLLKNINFGRWTPIRKYSSKHKKVKTFYISMMIWVCCGQYALTIFFRQMVLTNFISNQEKSRNMGKKRNITLNAIQHAIGTFKHCCRPSTHSFWWTSQPSATMLKSWQP